MNFETLLKQIVKEAVAEAIKENIGNIIVNASKEKPKVETVLLNNESEEPKNWGTNDEPVEEIIQEPETEESEVDLGSMKLKELREYAEELGLNSKGKRAEVEDRIREFLENEDTEEDEDLGEEPEEEESEEPETEENEEDEDSEEAEDDEVEDETYAKVMQYVNEASDDELRETLEELGLSSKGKREALVEKIYQAVKDGLFEFEEEDEEPSEEPEEEVEVEDTEDDSEEDDSEDLGMTEERAKAIEAMEEQVQEEFEEGKITRKEMVAYLKQVGIAVTKKVEDEAVVEMYTEKLALLIDDEGEFHDEGGDPYNINEVPYCCGAPLEEIEGGYRCNVCGTEYEAE